MISPSIGQSYSIGDALIHSACMFIAGSVFFSFATLLSSLFGDIWRPLLIALAIAIVLSFCEQVIPFGIFHVMHGESYFRTGSLPWLGLILSAALSLAMQYGAAKNVARRDF